LILVKLTLLLSVRLPKRLQFCVSALLSRLPNASDKYGSLEAFFPFYSFNSFNPINDSATDGCAANILHVALAHVASRRMFLRGDKAQRSVDWNDE
jgi:hypothetical protein